MGVSTLHTSKHQRKNIPICARIASRVLCGLGLYLMNWCLSLFLSGTKANECFGNGSTLKSSIASGLAMDPLFDQKALKSSIASYFGFSCVSLDDHFTTNARRVLCLVLPSFWNQKTQRAKYRASNQQAYFPCTGFPLSIFGHEHLSVQGASV